MAPGLVLRDLSAFYSDKSQTGRSFRKILPVIESHLVQTSCLLEVIGVKEGLRVAIPADAGTSELNRHLKLLIWFQNLMPRRIYHIGSSMCENAVDFQTIGDCEDRQSLPWLQPAAICNSELQPLPTRDVCCHFRRKDLSMRRRGVQGGERSLGPGHRFVVPKARGFSGWAAAAGKAS
jgi:hypothetical protein